MAVLNGHGSTDRLRSSRPGRDADGRVLITMRAGGKRALSLPSEVPGRLAFAARARPDGTAFPSVSAAGLWSCVGSRVGFDEWFRERASRLGLREGTDFFPAPPHPDSADRVDVPAVYYVDVLSAVMLVHGSLSEAGCAAHDFLDGLRRRLAVVLMDGAAGGAVEGASGPHAPSAGPELPPVLEGRPLDVVRRIVGTEDMPVVSARELHRHVDPAHQFAAWWRRMVRTMALEEGDDFQAMVPGRTSAGEHGRAIVDYWLPLRVARKLAALAPLEVRDPLVDYLRAWALAHPRRSAWPAPSPMAGVLIIPEGHIAGVMDVEVGEPAPGGAGDPVEAEPWAEAFDFGRLVPVMEREIGGVMQPTVSARDVHTFLSSGRDFTNWAKYQVSKCSLVDGVDFSVGNLAKFGEVTRRGPAPTDYVFTLAAAKKVAMVS